MAAFLLAPSGVPTIFFFCLVYEISPSREVEISANCAYEITLIYKNGDELEQLGSQDVDVLRRDPMSCP